MLLSIPQASIAHLASSIDRNLLAHTLRNFPMIGAIKTCSAGILYNKLCWRDLVEA